MCFFVENLTDMRMCEDLGQAIGVENQYDSTNDDHKFVYCWFSLDVLLDFRLRSA